MAAQADVLIENFRPGVSDRLGVGYEQIRALNPDIIYVSITGFGPQGPYAGQRTYDAVVQAVSGMADSQASGDKPPALISSIICDKIAGMTAAQAISVALFAKARGGGGQRISISMLEASLAFNWPDVMWNQTFASPDFVRGQTLAETYRLWRTKDGHLAIVFITDKAFGAWCRALDAAPEILAERFASEAGSRVRWRELAPMWEAKLASLTTDEALERLHREGVPAGAVRARERLFEDPQVMHNQAIAEVAGGPRGVIRMAKPGARFADHPYAPPSPAPEVGEHSREILQSFGPFGRRDRQTGRGRRCGLEHMTSRSYRPHDCARGAGL